MKRYYIIGVLWFFISLSMIQTTAKAEIEYQINFDKKTEETYPLKQEIQSIYQELISGVHKESYILMVLHNKERFAYKDNLKVEWKNNTLYITEGDGKGDVISGALKTESVCIPEVQPRSLLKEFFSF